MIVLEGRNQEPKSLTFSPNGTLLACGGSATHVQLWDLSKPSKALGVLGPAGPHEAVVFLSDDLLLTATCRPHKARGTGCLRLARRPFTSLLCSVADSPAPAYWDAVPTLDRQAVVLVTLSGNYPGTHGTYLECREL